ncbi:MAG: RNA-binding protein [Rhizobiaceae bacterium]
MIERTCIVTRNQGGRDSLIRFVAGPGGDVVPDLKQKLPGRGCWVTGTRVNVDKAVRKNLFARALQMSVKPAKDLGFTVDGLLARQALGSLGLARKAGEVSLGAAKVESAVRSGSALALLHAIEASEDGLRKLNQARRAVLAAGGPDINAYKLFSEREMSLALGGTNVIHAALLTGSASKAALKRIIALGVYRGVPGGNEDDVSALAHSVAS